LTLFQEVNLDTFAGGQINGIQPGSVADDIGLKKGDALLAINDQPVEDVIDVQFFGAEEELELLIRRDDEMLLFKAKRDYLQTLGLIFEHPTFDIDIRRCNNLCEFCFVLQMAPKFRRTLYIKDDDYRYSFLFGHFVTLTNLKEHDWQRIEMMRLSPLYVSVHVTDLEMRRRFLRNDKAEDIIKQLQWLVSKGIEVHTQLVIVPGFNDGKWLQKSIEELANLWPGVRSISIVPVGLTKFNNYQMRPHTKAEAKQVLDYILSLQPEYQDRFGIRFVYPTDEWYLVTGREVPPMAAYDDQALMENGLGMVRYFLDDWVTLQEEIKNWLEKESKNTLQYWTNKQLTLVTGTLFASTLSKSAERFTKITQVQSQVISVSNKRLGETITVAGLLMAEDVISQLQEVGFGDLIVLPRVMFDHPEIISLDDLEPLEVANRLNRPVALADTMGDVWDAITGASLVVFNPDG
jgi:putative radical SAM enzyme (TIGR03279 family)